MVVAVVASLAALVIVLVAYARDEPLDPAPPGPRWGPLPSPSDVAQVELPLALPGYEPAAVEATLSALGDAYADLLAVADARTLERARHRAALRLGVATEVATEGPAVPTGTAEAGTGAPGERDELEALRTEAALAWISEQDEERP